MDFEEQALIEANNLTDLQLQNFYKELNLIPSLRAPLNGHDAILAFEFMEDTGCRVNEMIHVKKQDINFRTRILTVTNPKVSAICSCAKWKYRDLYSRIRVIEHTDSNCKKCLGTGRWKQEQKTTITPRLIDKVKEYCESLKDDELLFPVHRTTLWKWGKKAGTLAGINIFQVKKTREIDGVFLHLFRALCSKRMVRDAQNDPYKDQLVACKLRHSFGTVTDRYTKIDINYLWGWEEKTYSTMEEHTKTSSQPEST